MTFNIFPFVQQWVRTVFVLLKPHLVDDCAILKIGDLLEIQIRTVVNRHPGIAVIRRPKRAPRRWVGYESVRVLLASGGSGNDMNGCGRIDVRLSGNVVNHAIIYWIHSFVRMFMSPKFQIYAIIVKQRFQSVGVNVRNTTSDNTFVSCAIVRVVIWTIHRSMSHRNYPGYIFSVHLSLLQIIFQPCKLIYDLLPTKIDIIIHFRTKTDNMSRSNIKTVE